MPPVVGALGDQILDRNWFKSIVPSSPAAPAVRTPVRWGNLTGIAVTTVGGGGNAATECTVDFGPRADSLSVKGVDDSGNSAVADGDSIFYVDADTPHLSKKSSGYLYGVARAAVNSGATATIVVDKVVTPAASGTIGAGGVGATQLGTASVTAVKLSATLKTGYIPLSLNTARIIASNAIANLTEGGIPDGNTDPILQRINGATDKNWRLVWAAASVVELAFEPFALPPDIDDASAIIVNLLVSKDTNTDNAAVIAVGYFQGIGDTNAGGNTAALATAAITKYTRSIAASDVQVYPDMVAITLIPGTHGTDAIRLHAAWIEYTRA